METSFKLVLAALAPIVHVHEAGTAPDTDRVPLAAELVRIGPSPEHSKDRGADEIREIKSSDANTQAAPRTHNRSVGSFA